MPLQPKTVSGDHRLADDRADIERDDRRDRNRAPRNARRTMTVRWVRPFARAADVVLVHHLSRLARGSSACSWRKRSG